MKKTLILTTLGIALGLTACSTYQGGTGSDTETTYGTAADMRSPSGMDRAKGTNAFDTLPPLPDVPSSGY